MRISLSGAFAPLAAAVVVASTIPAASQVARPLSALVAGDKDDGVVIQVRGFGGGGGGGFHRGGGGGMRLGGGSFHGGGMRVAQGGYRGGGMRVAQRGYGDGGMRVAQGGFREHNVHHGNRHAHRHHGHHHGGNHWNGWGWGRRRFGGGLRPRLWLRSVWLSLWLWLWLRLSSLWLRLCSLWLRCFGSGDLCQTRSRVRPIPRHLRDS